MAAEQGKHYLGEDGSIGAPPKAGPAAVRPRVGSAFVSSERHFVAEEATNNCRQTLASLITPKFILGLVVWLAMISGFGYLYLSGLLLELSKSIKDLGVAGWAIFVVILILVAQPFAWGFSATILATGFVYGWLGAAIVFVGSVIGCSITFFEVRYFARDYLQAKVDKMEPRLQLIYKEIERSATKTVYSSYPMLVGIRSTPLPYGVTNSLFALTTVSYARYVITACLSFCISIPVNINLGIVLRQITDVKDDTGGNKTAAEAALLEQSKTIETISLAISVVLTVAVLIASAVYGRWVVKQVDKIDDSEVIREIEEINEEINLSEAEDPLGFSRESLRLSGRYSVKASQLSVSG